MVSDLEFSVPLLLKFSWDDLALHMWRFVSKSRQVPYPFSKLYLLNFRNIPICSLISALSLYNEPNFIFPCFSVLWLKGIVFISFDYWIYWLCSYTSWPVRCLFLGWLVGFFCHSLIFTKVFETFPTIFCLTVSLPDKTGTLNLTTFPLYSRKRFLRFFAWLTSLVLSLP